MTNIRYDIFPQMEDYDAMEAGKIVPFAMLSGPMNYKSKRINTDRHGFRLTKFNGEYIGIDDLSSFECVNFVIGGSSVFGVGASDDDHSIASLLSQETNEPWFSLGIRGGVSLQEYIHLIRFIRKAKKVNNIVFFSGINDIYINLLTDYRNDFDNTFESDNSAQSCKEKVISYFLSRILFVDRSEIANKSFKEALLYRFGKRQDEAAKEILTDTERLDVLFGNFERNFLLYSALQDKLECTISYILQPFAHWTGKTLSEDEKQVFDHLDELQKDSKWGSQKSKFTPEAYTRIVNTVRQTALTNRITFVDSHPYFKNDATAFVDTVHLNDAGNEIAKNLILETISERNN